MGVAAEKLKTWRQVAIPDFQFVHEVIGLANQGIVVVAVEREVDCSGCRFQNANVDLLAPVKRLNVDALSVDVDRQPEERLRIRSRYAVGIPDQGVVVPILRSLKPEVLRITRCRTKSALIVA